MCNVTSGHHQGCIRAASSQKLQIPESCYSNSSSSSILTLKKATAAVHPSIPHLSHLLINPFIICLFIFPTVIPLLLLLLPVINIMQLALKVIVHLNPLGHILLVLAAASLILLLLLLLLLIFLLCSKQLIFISNLV